MRRGLSRRRTLTVLGVAVLAAGVVQSVPAGAADGVSPFASTRYEAESANCQGTIDSDHTGFSGTGFCNVTNAVGSFVEFTVSAASAGNATVILRFANGTAADRPMDISVNGSLAAAATSFPSTTTWDTWQSKTLSLPVNAGSNTIRATATTASGGPNVDFIDFEVGAAVTDLQAENATISQGVVESNHAGFTGTGFVNYDNVVGSFVEFPNVSAAAAGPASLTFRFANGTTTDRPMNITINGTSAAPAQSFPGTGAWTTWQEITINATLRAGANTVRATATTANGGPNLDRLRVGAPADTERPSAPGQPSCSDISFNALTLSWGGSSDNVGVVAYDIFNLGQKIAEAPNPPGPPFRVTGLSPSTRYQISVFARDAAGNESDTSPEIVCTTTADPGDPDPPTAPGQPTATNIGQTTATLSWGASTDNRGVTRYDIRVDSNNAVIDSVTGTPPPTTKVITVACGSHFVLHVVAKDAAGNTSSKSPTVTFDTQACGGGNNPGTPAQVSTGWDIPWDISWAPDGTFALVTERDTFQVFKINKNGSGKTQVGSVPNSQTTDGEGGLMGVAFSPTWNGTSDQEVFFMHTSSEGNRIAKMTFNGTALSGYTAIVTGIRKSRFHNGGRIRFGPDGFLYATTGDSQQSNLAQDPNSLNGKILRVTKTGAAAPGNPFGTRIWTLGHRNGQGLAWDAAGRLWESELGNSSADELNLIVAGRNYGWPTCEGNCNVSGMTNPKRTWSVAEASPSGLAFANGALFMAALRGQRLWRIVLNGENVASVSSHFTGTFGRLRAVVKVPGENAIWIGTTNSDNNGNGSPDRILRSNLS